MEQLLFALFVCLQINNNAKKWVVPLFSVLLFSFFACAFWLSLWRALLGTRSPF
jgi:hypothetical protein